MKIKRYYLVLSIGIVSLGLLLTGGTYAWLIFNEVTIGNNNLNVDTANFVIDYTSSLTGELIPSKTDKGGLSGTVTAKINSGAGVKSATGSLYLYANTGTDSLLYEGTELGIALKYAVYSGNTRLAYGTVNSDIIKNDVPNGMLIYDGFKVKNTQATTYTVYLWLDGELVDNRYLGAKFSGSLNLKAVQDDI